MKIYSSLSWRMMCLWIFFKVAANMAELYFHYAHSPSMVNGGGLVMVKIKFLYKWTLFSLSRNLYPPSTRLYSMGDGDYFLKCFVKIGVVFKTIHLIDGHLSWLSLVDLKLLYFALYRQINILNITLSRVKFCLFTMHAYVRTYVRTYSERTTGRWGCVAWFLWFRDVDGE